MYCKKCKTDKYSRQVAQENGLYDIVCDRCHTVLSLANVPARQFWLIEIGGIHFWMEGTKEGLSKAGLKVVGGPK